MNKKKLLVGVAVLGSVAITAVTALTAHSAFKAGADSAATKWVHYKEAMPGSVSGTEKGIRDYYVQCGGNYQFEAPSSYTEGGAYDISEFAEDDPRFFTLEEGTVNKFDYPYDLKRVAKWGDSSLSIDNTIKHGTDGGSLKYTINSVPEKGYDYLKLTAPYIKNITPYDYLNFYVYNPTSHDSTITLLWCGDTTLPAKQWTEVRFNRSLIEYGQSGDGVTDWSGTRIPSTNITNLTFCLWFNKGFVAGESLYISSIKAVVDPEIQEYNIHKFDASSGTKNINVFQSKATAEFDSSVAYEGEKGSLKVTNTKGGETYVALTNPLEKDISSYSYIAFRVYNDNNYEISAGVLWAKDTKIAAKSWGEIKITVAEFDQINVQDFSKKIYKTNITGFAVRLMGAWTTGSVAHVSNVIVHK